MFKNLTSIAVWACFLCATLCQGRTQYYKPAAREQNLRRPTKEHFVPESAAQFSVREELLSLKKVRISITYLVLKTLSGIQTRPKKSEA